MSFSDFYGWAMTILIGVAIVVALLDAGIKLKKRWFGR